MDWYKFSIVDYQKQTEETPDAEDLAYRRLMDLYFLAERPITSDIDTLVEVIRLDADIIEPVLEAFFELTEQGYRHEGWQRQLDSMVRKRKLNQISGRLGGRGKKRVV